MNRMSKWVAAAAYLFFTMSVTTAQEEKKQDSRGKVFVQLEDLTVYDGLPGAGSNSVVGVGGSFGTGTTTERDESGNLLYLRTIDGQSRWLPNNAIEVTLEINENGAKRTETIRLENFEPKTLVLREETPSTYREILRIIPVYAASGQNPLSEKGKECP